MSITERFTKSLTSKNIQEFSELVNVPNLYINDIFANGLLHHMLSVYPDLSIDFYRKVIDNSNTDLNKNSPTILPPILCTKRDDIIDLMLSKQTFNVNDVFGENRSSAIYAIDENDLSLLEKLVKSGKLDITQLDILNHSMDKNMDAFRILLGLLDPYTCDKLNPVDHSIRGNKIEALDLLLEIGCNIAIPSIKLLVNSGSSEMVNVLIKHLKKVTNKKIILQLAINNNNVELFKSVTTFTKIIEYEDIYNNLDKSEIMAEIVQLANSNDELLRTLFMAIVNSKNPKNYTLLDSITGNRDVLIELVNQLIAFNKLDELDELVENTHILRGVFSEVMKDNHWLLSELLKNDKVQTVKKILEQYELDLDDIPIKLDGFFLKEQFELLLLLLTKYRIVIKNDKILDELIRIQHFELVKVLVEKYGILPQDSILAKKLLDSDPEIIRTIIRSNTKILSKDITVGEFVKIMDIIGDDSELSNIYIGLLESYTVRELLTVGGNLEEILKHPKYVFKIVTHSEFSEVLFSKVLERLPIGPWDEDDEYDEYSKFVIIEVLAVIKTKEERDLIMDTIIGTDDIGYLMEIDPLERVIRTEDSEYFGYMLEKLKDELYGLSLSRYLKLDTKITLDNIDRMLELPDIQVTDSLSELCNLLDNELYSRRISSSRIIDKVLDHPNFVVNRLIDVSKGGDDEADSEKISVLDVILGDVTRDDYDAKNWRNQERLRLIKKLLTHPSIDVNIESLNGITAAHYIISNILTFSGNDYESEDSFSYPHAALRLILAHHRFDINLNRKVLPLMMSDREGDYSYLLTILISRPECDVNYCRVLHGACNNKKLDILKLVLTLPRVNVNLLALDEREGFNVTPMHVAIENNFVEGIKLLLEDPRFDVTVLDSKGRNYSRLAAKSGLKEIVALFAARGVVDDKQERIDREVAEYEARMAAQGRVKQTRIRETLNSFDLILNEREHSKEDYNEHFSGSITAYNRSICPFCLTYLEKENPYECVYLSGHRCPEELENEPLKRLYFGDEWATKVFEICCTCGRPCEHHGHFTPVETGGPSELARNDELANHWACDSHNGGGGKLEMVTRLLGMLSELKRRVDSDERLVYGPELIRELAMIANASLFNGAIRDRAVSVLERKKWNSNSKIEKYKKFNAPSEVRRNNNNSRRMRNVREPIVHYDNPDEQLQCMICLDEAEHLFKPHESDEGYICDSCIQRQVCASRYASVTCELGCRPKKQIHKEDVNALMGGNFCEGVEMAEARANADDE